MNIRKLIVLDSKLIKQAQEIYGRLNSMPGKFNLSATIREALAEWVKKRSG